MEARSGSTAMEDVVFTVDPVVFDKDTNDTFTNEEKIRWISRNL